MSHEERVVTLPRVILILEILFQLVVTKLLIFKITAEFNSALLSPEVFLNLSVKSSKAVNAKI